MTEQWFEKNPERLAVEMRAVQERFPSFEFRRIRDGGLCLKGKLRTLSGATHDVVLVYSSNFPQTAPKVYPIPRRDGPHQYSDGSMCLYGTNDRVWLSTSTAPVILALAALWLHAYDIYRQTGRWPGRQHT